MKEKKLFSSMSYIDEELVDEALNVKKRKLPVLKFATVAAALIFIALSAAIVVSIQKPADIVEQSASERSDVQVSVENEQTKKQPEKTVSEAEKEKVESSVVLPTETEESTVTEIKTASSAATEEHVDSDVLGFIIKDGKTYMQVFNDTQYMLDKEIGFARDFKGAYHGLDDNSKVYTVKEDEKILVIKFEAGGSVTLMLWEEGLQDSSGYYHFNGLRVDRSLMAALSSNDGKAYSVYVTRPDSDDMNDYVYNGKTIGDEKKEMNEIMKQTAIRLWITGESDGQKLVSAWGEDFLTEAEKIREEYRIFGTDNYDTAKAKEDAQRFDQKYDEAYKTLQDSLEAFLKEKIKKIYDILLANGIEAELVNEVRCEAKMTKEQLETLAASDSNFDEYAFGLLSGGNSVDDPDA